MMSIIPMSIIPLKMTMRKINLMNILISIQHFHMSMSIPMIFIIDTDIELVLTISIHFIGSLLTNFRVVYFIPTFRTFS